MSEQRTKFTSIYSDLIISSRIKTGIIAALIVLLFFSIRSNSKPPIVIRESLDRVSVSDNYQADSSVTKYDTEIFIRHFIQDLNFLDSFSLEENLPRALNMMDEKLLDYYKTEVCKPEFIHKVLKQDTKTKTKIREIHFDSTSKDMVSATVIYDREIIDYNSTQSVIKTLRGEMIIKKLDGRSRKNPYGLLVSQFKEIPLN